MSDSEKWCKKNTLWSWKIIFFVHDTHTTNAMEEMAVVVNICRWQTRNNGCGSNDTIHDDEDNHDGGS
jgi:phage-related protein